MTAQYFPNDVRDAFLNAFRLPNLFRRLLGEGSLSVAFIPVFIEILSGRQPRNESDRRARELVGGVFSILLSMTIAISTLAIIFMEEILGPILSGAAYHSVPGKFALTVHLGRIMFGFLVLISLYAYFMAIQNSLKKFAVSAFAPCFFNLTIIAAVLSSARLGVSETILAWAVLAGGAAQMAVLIPGLIRSGFFPRPSFRWNNPDVAKVFKGFLPSLFGMSIMQLSAIVNMHFASRLPSGSQSYLYFADRILELPISLFVVSTGTALLPTLSGYFAARDRRGMTETINHSIRLILFIALPAGVGMFVLAQPIVDVLFLGREFRYQDAIQTAQVIQIYSFAVLVAAGVRIFAQGFYATQNTWFPAVSGAVSLCTHVIFAMAFTAKFGLPGLAFASVCSAAVNLILLLTGYRAWIGTLQIRILFWRLVRFSICAAAMYGVLLTHPYFQRMLGARFYSKAFVLFAVIALGAAVYMLAAKLLRVPEYREASAMFSEKLAKRLKPKS